MTDVGGLLQAHLSDWLGMWPPPPSQVVAVSCQWRARAGWDGQIHPFVGVASPDGAVLSTPPAAVPKVSELIAAASTEPGSGVSAVLDAVGERLADLVWTGSKWGTGCFRWTDRPAGLEDVGEWVERDDPRVPEWMAPFNGEVLVAWDEDGRYAAGVGRKMHNQWGHELAVATEERMQGRGLATRLVAQAARQVLADGAVPTYLHSHRNRASARVAEAAGFRERGWQTLGLWGRSEP